MVRYFEVVDRFDLPSFTGVEECCLCDEDDDFDLRPFDSCTGSDDSNSPFRSSSSSWPINDFRLSSSESMADVDGLLPVPAVVALELNIPLARDRPDGAVELLPVELLLGVTFVLDLLFVVFVLEELLLVDVEEMVGVVEVKTFEKLPKPFIRLGLFKNGDVKPKLPKLSGL